MQNPFDIQSALLARHAQHVVLVHFPIGLFITGVVFDLLAFWTKRRGLADAAYYDLLGAAASTLPVVVTGILAWQFQLEGQALKGILKMHLILGCLSSTVIIVVACTHFFYRRRKQPLPTHRIVVELAGLALISLTGHLGGFLSGVNGAG
jgi:uncharacterized membrane protein